MKNLSASQKKFMLENQKDEINSFHVYSRLAKKIKNKKNAKLLREIAQNEKVHYDILKSYSGEDVKPSKIFIVFFEIIGRLLGLTFALKLLEKGEKNAAHAYAAMEGSIPELTAIIEDEERHERELIDLLDEAKLNYMGSIVLGLNDALVELTGALAGYTFAMQNSRLIGLIGLITGIAASLSMASSEFLSKKQEGEHDDALSSSIYTGVAYIITVILLVTPFLLFTNHYINLGISISIAIAIIFFFNYYISVAKDLSFKKRFFEMAGISVGVALISFGIGWFVKTFIGLDM